MSYEIVYSARRKTVALQIQNGKLKVRAPVYLSKNDIDRFVRAKSAWIEQKLRLSVEKISTFIYQDGAEIYLRGRLTRINVCASNKHRTAYVNESGLFVNLNHSSMNLPCLKQQSIIRELIADFCLNDCNDYLQQKLNDFAALMKVEPQGYKIRIYKSRWGSCNSKGMLTFNALLAMVPRQVFDYVIVHELAHLIYMDHSANFWRQVEQVLPLYQTSKAWLKQHAKYLVLPPV